MWGGHLHVEYKGSRKEVVQAVLEEHGRDCKQFRVLERLSLEVSLALKSISFRFVMETEKRLIEDCEHLGKCLYGKQMFDAATFWISVKPSHMESLHNSKHCCLTAACYSTSRKHLVSQVFQQSSKK